MPIANILSGDTPLTPETISATAGISMAPTVRSQIGEALATMSINKGWMESWDLLVAIAPIYGVNTVKNAAAILASRWEQEPDLLTPTEQLGVLVEMGL